MPISKNTAAEPLAVAKVFFLKEVKPQIHH